MIGQPGRAARQRNDRIQPVSAQRAVQAAAGQPARGLPRGRPGRVGRIAAGGFGLLEDLLAEVGQHAIPVTDIERNQLGEAGRAILPAVPPGRRSGRCLNSCSSAVISGSLISSAPGSSTGSITSAPSERSRATAASSTRRGSRAGRLRAVPPDAEPGAGQRAGVEERRVLPGAGRRAGACAGVAGSAGSAPASAASSSAASATQLVIGPAVSWAAETGTIPVRLTRPTVGLSPTTPQALAGDTIDPSVSVPIASRGQPGRDRHRRARTRARRVPALAPGVHGLAAERAPAAAGAGRAEVRPLGEVRLAEDHRTRLAQPGDQERVGGFAS